MRVLIIPEDPTLDQHVLKPVIRRIFSDLGRPARVDVLTNPHLSGISQALDPSMIKDIIEDNRMIDLFVLAVDRDCDRFGNTTKATQRVAEHPDKLVAVVAQEELEVWPLALHRQDLSAAWSAVCSECDPKEHYWDPFVQAKGWLSTVGKGRKKAMRPLGSGWQGMQQVCPEIRTLKQSIQSWLEGHAP